MNECLHCEDQRAGPQVRPSPPRDAAAGEFAGHPLSERVPQLAETGLEFRGAGRLPVEDAMNPRISAVRRHSGFHQEVHRGLEVRGGLGALERSEHGLGAFGQMPVGEPVEQRFSAREPLVERTDRNPGPSSNRRCGGAGEAVLGELVGSGVKECGEASPCSLLLRHPDWALHSISVGAILTKMNDPHVTRYASWVQGEDAVPLVEPRSEWLPLSTETTLHLHRHPAPGDPAATVIVLHGGGGHARMLAAVGVLAQQLGAEAVAPDLPGYGHTVVPDRRAVRYGDWVDAVVELAQNVRSERRLLFLGASMGGRLALDVAYRLGPGSVQGVVATCLLNPRRPDARAVVARHQLLVRAGLPILRATRAVTDPWMVPIRWLAPIDRIANDPVLARTCATDPHGAGTSVPLGFLRTWLEYEPGYEPATFAACPVVLAHPGDDRWTPLAVSRSFLDELAVPTELIVLDGCGHFPVEPGALPGLRTALQHTMSPAPLS